MQGYQGDINGYIPSTEKLELFSNVNAFVINGLGLEKYTDKIEEGYTNVKIIDASISATGTSNLPNGEVNKYIWMDLGNYISQVREVAKQLSELDVNNKEIYEQNAQQYIKELSNLKVKYDTELIHLNGKQIVSMQEGFSYIVKNANMTEITIFYEDKETQMDQESVNMITQVIDDRQIKVILLDKNDPTHNADKLVQKTDAKIYKLDLCIDGSKDKNAYLNSMQGNFNILKDMGI